MSLLLPVAPLANKAVQVVNAAIICPEPAKGLSDFNTSNLGCYLSWFVIGEC